MWDGLAFAAWASLAQHALVRRRGGLLVLEGPAGRTAPLWPWIHVLWAAADVRAIGGSDAPLDELAASLERFRRGDAYAAAPRDRRRYFDDNAWLGLAAADAETATDDERWRRLGRGLLPFLAGGEHPDGGIRWREGSESRNACSTASAAWLAATIGGTSASAQAGRWLDWLDRTLRRDDGLIADRIERGRVEPTAWTYNQGATIAATWAIGQDPTNLLDATIERWDTDALWREPPPFVAIAVRAMLFVRDRREDIVAWIDPYLERLANRAGDPVTGWLVGSGLGTYDGRPTIDQAAIVELFSLRARAADDGVPAAGRWVP